MKRISVHSSNIKSIGYCDDTLVLEIEFCDGNIYEYYEVPQNEYARLMAASSHGKYLYEYIRGKYEYKKIS